MKVFKIPVYTDAPPPANRGNRKKRISKRISKYAQILDLLKRGRWAAIGEGRSHSLHAQVAQLRKRFEGFEFASRANGKRGRSTFYARKK